MNFVLLCKIIGILAVLKRKVSFLFTNTIFYKGLRTRELIFKTKQAVFNLQGRKNKVQL